jgi:hypothetical protein
VVECQLPKLDVTGSSPVSRSMFSITYIYPIGILNSEMECSGLANRVPLICKLLILLAAETGMPAYHAMLRDDS